MFRDTKAINITIAEDAPPEPISLWQQFGLWYSPSAIADRNPDRLTARVRIPIAAFVAGLLSLYGTCFGALAIFSPDDFVFWALVHFSVAFIICMGMAGLSLSNFGNWFWCAFSFRKSDDQFNRSVVGFGLSSRAILVGVAYVILSQTAYNSPGDKERMLIGVGGGVLISLMLLDWRCFAAPHRPHRILIRPTIAAGLIAMFASMIVLGESRSEIMSAASSMSLALGLQLVAPLRRARLIVNQADSVSPMHHVDKSQTPLSRVDETQEIVR